MEEKTKAQTLLTELQSSKQELEKRVRALQRKQACLGQLETLICLQG